MSASASASSNWLALKKTLPAKPKKRKADGEPAADPSKRQKTEEASSFVRGTAPPLDVDDELLVNGVADASIDHTVELPATRNGESLAGLRDMIAGRTAHTAAQKQPGRYVALDCEMVGVGPGGAESVLARVSVVNFHGAVLLDAFVRPRERVVDYRTQFSGIRPADMAHARPFADVQAEVAALMKDKVLVGHALSNDMQALLLSHPRADTRDTQHCAWKHKLVGSNRVALRTLVHDELGVRIQAGEHSSVTDARATMAVFRIHRKTWESGRRAASDAPNPKTKSKTSTEEAPGGGRKGVSSGLSVVLTRKGGSKTGKGHAPAGAKAAKGTKAGWWKEMG